MLQELVSLEEKAANSATAAPPQMEAPSMVDACRACKRPIKYLEPKRNCDKCGRIFCAQCSAMYPSKAPHKQGAKQSDALCTGCRRL